VLDDFNAVAWPGWAAQFPLLQRNFCEIR